MRRLVFHSAVVVVILVAVVGCADADADAVGVVGTATTCEPANRSLTAGPVTFEFENKAPEVSELYVRTTDDEIVAEVENVTTGTKRQLVADLPAGTYVLVCKPGMTGDGIRTEITVTGDGGTPVAEPDRTYAMEGVDYEFTDFEPGAIEVTSGETIRFEMKNTGTVEHEFEVLKPDGEPLGEIGPTKVGESGKVTLTFSEPGTYVYVCGIDDHEERGMKGTFEVAAK